MSKGEAIEKAIVLLERIWDDTVSMGVDRGLPHVAEMAIEAKNLLKAAGDEWEPIGEKHKDGSCWQLWWRESVEVGYYVTKPVYRENRLEVAAGWHLQYGNMLSPDPTHAMPLPAPPNAPGGEHA